jgi:hypothetical protein
MLNLKSIISCNISGTPLVSCNLSKKINEYKKFVNENYNEKIKDDLVIISIQGLYGYRCGIFGYILNNLSYELSQNNNPTILKSILNLIISSKIESNDFEILSTSLSMIFRKIPLLNIGNWDLKERIIENDNIKYNTPNNSLPSIFDLKSIYLLNPLFDSGCTIFSNKKVTQSGFERWNATKNCNFLNKLFNRGINWSYFESEEKKNGITIINFEFIDSEDNDIYLSQINQIIELKKKLEIMFANNVDNNKFIKYETYILGDFKLEFNLKEIFENVQNIWKILENEGLCIINNTNISSTNFILYNKYCERSKLKTFLNICNKKNFIVEEDIIECIDFDFDNVNITKVLDELKEKFNKDEVIEINDEIYIESSIDKKIEENIKNEIEKVRSIEKIKDIQESESENIKNNDIIITINDDYFYKNPLNKNSDDEWEAI